MMYKGSRWSKELWMIRKWNSACKISLQHFPMGLKHWCWKPAVRVKNWKDLCLGLAGIGLQHCAHTQKKDPCIVLWGQQFNCSLSQEETIYSGCKCQTLDSVLAVTAWLGRGKVFWGISCSGSMVGIFSDWYHKHQASDRYTDAMWNWEWARRDWGIWWKDEEMLLAYSLFDPSWLEREFWNTCPGCLTCGIRAVTVINLRSSVLQELLDGPLGIITMKILAGNLLWWPDTDTQIGGMTKQCQGY